ncbi:MAG: hypothetical protein ABSD31_05520 [Candidatus Binataceae bacterium]|jgi:hypothetical protein
MLGGRNAWRPSRLLLLSIVLCAINCPDGLARAQTWYALKPVDLTIYSPGRKQILGHSHYELAAVPGGAEIRGEARFLDGESDVERDRIVFSTPEEIPALAKFSHIFFLADGRLRMTVQADFKSGIASCDWYQDGSRTTVTEMLSFPRDTYAGATALIPIEYALRHGTSNGIKFHLFTCGPKPRIVELDASANSSEKRWPPYTGSLVRIRVRPDLGWLTLLAAPFLPKFYEWFDPGQSWRYLGGTTERFYRGQVLELVREAGPPGDQPPAAPSYSPDLMPTE